MPLPNSRFCYEVRRGLTLKRLIAITLAGASMPALAHHPLAGVEMTTFFHGLLSGIGHPLLGFDHLFFVVLVGVAAVYTGYARLAPAGYIAAMAVGCVAMTFGLALPGVEVVVALSLLVLGCIVLSGRSLGMSSALVLFAVAGLFHGAAFGESMAAAEASSTMQVLTGYLIGLGVLQYAICVGAGWVAVNIWQATEATAVPTRLAGAMVAGAGLFLSLEAAEGMAFAALGIG